jgi:hypothetical protein
MILFIPSIKMSSVRSLVGYRVSSLLFDLIKEDGVSYDAVFLELIHDDPDGKPITIKVAIENFLSCCEEWGLFLISPNGYLVDTNEPVEEIDEDLEVEHKDNVKITIASNQFQFCLEDISDKPLLEVRIASDHILNQFQTDDILGVYSHVPKIDNPNSSILAINLTFKDGSIAQIIAFNNHNGYYSHNAFVTYDTYRLDTEL